ncbi:hypothetical protein [Streptomyces echinatus]|uniref:hypothetical protein n=1 Tax=Streptomyces echinatus TaxID=67293 RepID=UPI0037A2A3B8
MQRSIDDPTLYAAAARSLLKALRSRPRTRLIVIGGAGSLEVEPGVVRADSDELLHAALDRLGLPRGYAAAVRGHRDQPVLDADGRSRVSVEDAAVALLDEAELPRFVQRRFTIGY